MTKVITSIRYISPLVGVRTVATTVAFACVLVRSFCIWLLLGSNAGMLVWVAWLLRVYGRCGGGGSCWLMFPLVVPFKCFMI